MPPFGVKNEIQINDELGLSALPSNFTALPITTYKNPDVWNDVAYDGCKYAQETDEARWGNPTVFSKYTPISDAAKPGTQAYLNLTSAEIDPADFSKMNDYTDTLRCLGFEGVNGTNAFTNDTLKDAMNI